MPSYVLVFLSWRTFTMSLPLQQGIRAYPQWVYTHWVYSLRLLRRLRPPLRPLAFSRPLCTGKAVREFPNSKAGNVIAPKCIATLSCLLYAGWIRDNTRRTYNRRAPHHPILGQVYQSLSPVRRYDASNADFSRQHRSQDWSVNCLWLAEAELLSASFRPKGLPTPHSCRLVLVPLSKYNSFGHRATPPTAERQGGPLLVCR